MELDKDKKGIIFAADLNKKNELFTILKEISSKIQAIKIGNIVLYKYGWEIIGEIKKFIDVPVIVDLKLMDIPAISGSIAKSAIKAGADGIMVCGICGADTLSTCREATSGKLLFIFTQFTHESGMIPDSMADDCINLANRLGCDGIQVPGTKPDRIKEIRSRIGSSMMIITCGIGAQGPEFGSAISAGADFEIIGRSIYNSKKPLITVTSILNRIHRNRKVSNQKV